MKKHIILSLLLLMGAAAVIAQSIPSNVPTTGLVAYYGFDGNANDLSGNNNNGTLGNAGSGASNPAAATDRFGNANSAYEFGGVDNANWITVPNSASLRFSDAMTVSFWMMQSSARGTNQSMCEYYLTGGTDNDNTMFMALSKGGTSQCGSTPGISFITLYSGNTQTLRFVNTNTDYASGIIRNMEYKCYAPKEWIHYVVTIENRSIKVYANSVLIFENTEMSAFDFSMANTNDLVIGAMKASGGNIYPFSGKLDDIAIYNRQLSYDEVKSLFNGYEDPYSSEPAIHIDNVEVVNPCGTNNGTITITPKAIGGITYQYGTNMNTLQSSNTISAAPGLVHYYVASTCRQWDTTITLVCDCADDPSLVSYDTVCFGRSGSGGKENDSISSFDFENYADYWSFQGYWECASGERNHELFGYTYPIYGPHSGSKAYFCSNLNYSYGSFAHSTNYLTSPAVTFPKDPSVTPTTLSFYFLSIGVSNDATQRYNTIRLEYATSTSGPWTPIWTYGEVQREWEQVSIPLSSYISTAGTYFFRFMVDGIGYVSAFDDFVVTTDTRWSIPDEVAAAAPDSTVRVEKELSFSGACPVTEITFWYVTPPTEHHVYRSVCAGATGQWGDPNEDVSSTSFENGNDGWTYDGYWARARGESGYNYLNGMTSPIFSAPEGSFSFFCSNLRSGATSTSFPRSVSYLYAPAINIDYDPSITPVTLTFWAYAAGFNSNLVGAIYDTLLIECAASQSGPWVELGMIGGANREHQTWAQYAITLSDFITEAGTYYLRFVTKGAGYSTGVDGVQITANTAWTIPDTVTNGTPGDTIITISTRSDGSSCTTYDITHWYIYPTDTLYDTISLCPNATADTIPATVRNAAPGDTIPITDTLTNDNGCNYYKITYWCLFPIDTTTDTQYVCLNDTSADIPASVHDAAPGDTVTTIDPLPHDNGCMVQRTTYWCIAPLEQEADTQQVCLNDTSANIPTSIHDAAPGDTVITIDTLAKDDGCMVQLTTYWCIYPVSDSTDTVTVCLNASGADIPDTVRTATPGDTIATIDTVLNAAGCPVSRTTYWIISPLDESSETHQICLDNLTPGVPPEVYNAAAGDTITIVDTIVNASGCPVQQTSYWFVFGAHDTNIYREVCPGSSGTFGDEFFPILNHNFESGTNGWTYDGYWARGTGESNYNYLRLPQAYYHASQGSYAFFCSNLQTLPSGDDTEFPTSISRLTSPGLIINHDPILTPIAVTFSAYLSGFSNTDENDPSIEFGRYYDTLTLSISSSAEGPWTEVWRIEGPGHGPWDTFTVQLSPYLPASGTYYFQFVTTGEGYGTGIDDFQITADTRWTIPDEVTNAPADTTITTTRTIENAGLCSTTETTHWTIFPMDEAADTQWVCQNATDTDLPDNVRNAQPGDTVFTEDTLVSDNGCRYKKTTFWIIKPAQDTSVYEEVCSSDPREGIPPQVRRATPGDTIRSMAAITNEQGCTVRKNTFWIVKDSRDTNIEREVCPGTAGAFGYSDESIIYNDFEDNTQAWIAAGFWARGRSETNFRYVNFPSAYYSAHQGAFAYFCSNLQTSASDGNNYFPSTTSNLTSPGFAIDHDPIMTPIKVSFYACISGFRNTDQYTGIDYGRYYDTLALQYAASPDGPWTEIWRAGGEGHGNWTQYSVYLSSYITTPGTYYFRFVTQGAGYCTGVDDFHISANTYWEIPTSVTNAAAGSTLTTTRRIENTGACTTSEITHWTIRTSTDSIFKDEDVCPGAASSTGYEAEEIKSFDLEGSSSGWTYDGYWAWASSESNFRNLNFSSAALSANSGTYAFFCSNLQNDNNNEFFPITTSYLYSPAIDINYDPVQTPVAVRFHAIISGFRSDIEGRASTEYYNTLILEYSSSPTGPWTEVWRGGGRSGYGQWTEYTANLSTYIAEPGTYYFRFANIGAGYCTAIDDFKLTANTYWSIPASVLAAPSGSDVTTTRTLTNADKCYTTEVTLWHIKTAADTVKLYDSVCPGEFKAVGNKAEVIASHDAESRTHGWTADGFWAWGRGETCYPYMDFTSPYYHAHAGNYAFFCSNLQTNKTNTYFPVTTSNLTSPAIDINFSPTAAPISLQFYAYLSGFTSTMPDGTTTAYFNTLILQYATSADGPWSEIWRIEGAGHGDWQLYTVDFSAHMTDSGIYYFRFVNIGPGYSSGVDDFQVTADTYRSTSAAVTSAAGGSTVPTERIIYNAVNCYTTEITYWYVKPTTHSDTSITAVDSYTWGGHTYNTSDTYYQTGLTNAAGCDSSATLHLTIVPSTTIVRRYDTLCPGETGYRTYMDTLYYEDFDGHDNSCWSAVNGPRSNGFRIGTQVCNTQSTDYCHNAYDGNSLFEPSAGIVSMEDNTTELINYYTSQFVTPSINIIDPSQTTLSFYFYSEAAGYTGTCYDMTGHVVDCDSYDAYFMDDNTRIVYDEIGVLSRNSDPNLIWDENGEGPFTDYDTWTRKTLPLSTLNAGLSELRFLHVSKGGVGYGLDNILVYGPRRISIPRAATAGQPGTTVVTRDTIFGRSGCDTTIIETYWYVRPVRTTTESIFADLEYTWHDSTYTESGTYVFTDLIDMYGCDSIDTLQLMIRERYPVIFEDCDARLQFPNIITPNGDGVNDRFHIVGLDNGCYPTNELAIYNRWGTRVYYAKNLQSGLDSWEPTNIPTGTYFYRFQGRNAYGTIDRFGVVEIIQE